MPAVQAAVPRDRLPRARHLGGAELDCFVIANPRAGKGRVAREWDELLAALRRAGLDASGSLTSGPGEAVELAARARTEGRGMVVAVGGDGTVHEVVNGLLADGPGPDVAVLGIVPAGRGCDFAKTFDIPAELELAAARLAAPGDPLPVDVGRVTCPEGTRLFVNIAEAGLGPAVVARAESMPRRLGGAVYLFAFWRTLPGFRRPRAEIATDDSSYDGPMTNLVVANGKFFGGGMRIAPGADPSDGLFDVQIHWGSKPDYVRAIPRVYKGTHLPHPKVMEKRSTTVKVHCDPAVLVEADGEVLGTTPATFEIMPGALRLIV